MIPLNELATAHDSFRDIARMQVMPGENMGTLYTYENFCAKYRSN